MLTRDQVAELRRIVDDIKSTEASLALAPHGSELRARLSFALVAAEERLEAFLLGLEGRNT